MGKMKFRCHLCGNKCKHRKVIPDYDSGAYRVMVCLRCFEEYGDRP